MALEAIDWRYYFIFVGLNLVYGAFWYVFGVETRGRTLEELDKVFEAKWPPKAALEKTVVRTNVFDCLEAVPEDNEH